MKGYKAILTYNGEKVVGTVASVSIYGLAVVEFKAEELKDVVPLRICNVRPGWLMWGNRAEGDGWCLAWAPRSRDVVEADAKSGSSAALFLTFQLLIALRP